MTWAEQPLGGGAGGIAFSIGVGDLRASASADAPKPKQPYLRRNTGLQKRVLDARIKRYIPRGGFLTDPHEVEQKVPLGGKPASLRTGGGRGPAKAEPKPAPRTAPPRKAAKALLARASHDQAAAGRAPPPAVRAKAVQRAAIVEPPVQAHLASQPAARQVQRPVPAAGLTSSELDASRGLMPQLIITAQVLSKSLQDIDGFSATQQQGRHAPEPLRGDHSASVISVDHQEPQPASPGADSRTADKARRATAPLSPPGVVLDRLGLAGEGWPGSSAGGSSVGEEGPQAPSQLSDRRPDGIPPNLWLPDEGCAAGVQWPGAGNVDAPQHHDAATTEDDHGGLASVLAAVCDGAAAAVSTVQQGDGESSVLWEAEAALHRLPAKVRVPAQEPITLPPWGSRAAARPPPQQPLEEADSSDAGRARAEMMRLTRLRAQLELVVTRLQKDKAAFDAYKREEVAKWEAQRAEDARRLKRDRRELDQQARELLKLPTRKERAEVETLEETLRHERRSAAEKEARNKLNIDRLRRQIAELQDKNIELQREVRWHEEQRLKEYERLEAVQLCAGRGGTARSADRPAAVVHDDCPARSATLDPRQMPAGVQHGFGGHEDAGTGTDSEEEGDDEELASYSRVHGLTQPWPSEQPGPSRQRRLWDAARDRGADTGQTGPPHDARGGYAVDGAATGSRGEGDAASKDRASVSWDVPPDAPWSAPDPAADVDGFYEQSSRRRQQHGCAAAGDRWGPGAAWAATHSGQYEDLPGGYSQLHHDAHAGTSWQPHGILGPARSVSPSRAPSRQHAERAEPSIRRAWAPRCGAPDGQMTDSGEPADAAETCASCKQHSAPGQHADGESRAYWRRFAADAVPQGSNVACSGDHSGQAHDEDAGQGRTPANTPQVETSERTHGKAGGTAARRADGAGSSHDARRKVNVSSEQQTDGSAGGSTVCFGNGTLKETHGNGAVTLRFTNGDVKRSLPDGRVEYWYAQVQTWQTSLPDGVEVYHFASGQIEARHPSGTAEVVYPTGGARLVQADGSESSAEPSALSDASRMPCPASP